ncbi:hypothetical protein [Cardiobacterium valvarum]|uniref:Uncharacterized protein n=1 Tax=Cardiobacterium valvarum F0432 TaxID=797473 RepID=G9ZG43_9GAMM|nr:hypothetical protein [Cardiobacterium valvarum]EHM53399.1 hypothetical protein HMPREF9080_01757 [Cardiobacterium valvarum F0432]
MGKIQQFLSFIRKQFFRLNEKQRESIAQAFDKLATGAMVPVAFKLMSDGKEGDMIAICFWIVCATLFQILAIVARSTKEEGDDES